MINCPEKLVCTYVYIKQNLDQNVHESKNKNMYMKQNLDQNVHVSISKKIFLIQILMYNAQKSLPNAHDKWYIVGQCTT